MMSTGLARDQVSGRTSSSWLIVPGDNSAKCPPFGDQPVDGHDADPAAVGHDGQAFTAHAFGPGQGFDGCEQFIDVVDTQHASAADGRIVDIVRTGQRARVRGCGLGSLGDATRLDDHNRFVAGRRPAGRHELTAVLDGFDIEQDRCRAGVRGEKIDGVAEIDVGAVTERDEMGKTDLVFAGPIEDGGTHGTGLRGESDLAGVCLRVGEAGIQPDSGHDQAEAIGTKDSQAGFPGLGQHRFLDRHPVIRLGALQAGGEDDGGTGSAFSKGRDQTGDRRRRRADDGEVGNHRQGVDIRIGEDADDGLAFRVDRHDGAVEPAFKEMGWTPPTP